MLIDHDQLMRITHELMLQVATKLELKNKDLGYDEIQKHGYPEVSEEYGLYRFNPHVQEHVSDLIINTLLAENGLSLDGKINAVRLAILHTAQRHLYIETQEEKDQSEFKAFLDHFTKFGLKVEQKLNAGMVKPESTTSPEVSILEKDTLRRKTTP